MKKYLLPILLIAFWGCSEEFNDTDNEDLTEDCAGVIGGNAVLDNCGVCDDNADNDCTEDCAGIWGGENICGCTDESANNYNSEATYDDGSCAYSSSVNGTIIGVSWNWYDTYATMQFRLTNQGGATAYNVEYRLQYSYKCVGQITGSTAMEWTDFISCCDLQPGEYIDLEVQVTNLCTTNGGLNYFNFEIDYLTWD